MLFLDNASTTKISDNALKVYNEYSCDYYFNPSALYMKGAKIHQDIQNAKQDILKVLGANKFDNIIFTSGATESNNMVIQSFAKNGSKKALFGISEHPSVYNVAKHLQDNGYNIEFVNITDKGTIDIEDYKRKLTSDVNFISIMHVNNETGAINPIKELVNIAKNFNKNIVFHSDGVQALGKISVDIEDLGVDLYTISSHKIYGPKGIGALFVKKGINIKPMLLGGGQENNLRSGTENTPAIFAFRQAIIDAVSNVDNHFLEISKVNRYAKDKLLSLPYDISLNSNDMCSPYIISFAVANLRAETILRMLEDKDILIGNGSACSSKKKGNRVLSSMNIADKYIEGALRISFNYTTTISDIDTFIAELSRAISVYKENTNR